MFGEGKSGFESHTHLCVTQCGGLGDCLCRPALQQMVTVQGEVQVWHYLIAGVGYEDMNYRTGKFRKTNRDCRQLSGKVKPRWFGHLWLERAWEMRS